MALPVPENTVRVNVVWRTQAGELAVNTLNFVHQHVQGNTLDWAGDMTQRYANLVRDAFHSQWATMGGWFPTGFAIDRCDAYHLGVDGKTIDKATSPATGANVMAGTAGGTMLPLEVATCVSLYAYDPAGFTPNSHRKRGRIYLPPFTTSGVSVGRNVGYSNIATTMQAVMSYMQNRPMDDRTGTNIRERAALMVLSRKYNEANRITHVRVDDLFDVQRRRQNNLVPAIAVSPVVPQS